MQDAGTDIEETLSSIIIGIVQVLSTFLAVVLMDRAGRKILLLISAILMAISLGKFLKLLLHKDKEFY